jgi:hypothetical protein
MQKNLQKMAKLTALKKSFTVRLMSTIPVLYRYKLNKAQNGYKGNHEEYIKQIEDLNKDIKDIQSLREEAANRYNALGPQIEVVKSVIGELQRELWEAEKSEINNRVKSLQSAVHNTDALLADLLKVQAVSLAYINRLDQVIDISHQSYLNAQSFMNTDVSVVLSVTDRILNLEPSIKMEITPDENIQGSGTSDSFKPSMKDIKKQKNKLTNVSEIVQLMKSLLPKAKSASEMISILSYNTWTPSDLYKSEANRLWRDNIQLFISLKPTLAEIKNIIKTFDYVNDIIFIKKALLPTAKTASEMISILSYNTWIPSDLYKSEVNRLWKENLPLFKSLNPTPKEQKILWDLHGITIN